MNYLLNDRCPCPFIINAASVFPQTYQIDRYVVGGGTSFCVCRIQKAQGVCRQINRRDHSYVKGSFRELLSKNCGYARKSPSNKPDVVVTVADCACVQEVTTEAKRCVSWPRGGGADDVRRKLPGCLSKGQLSPTSDRPTRPQAVVYRPNWSVATIVSIQFNGSSRACHCY